MDERIVKLERQRALAKKHGLDEEARDLGRRIARIRKIARIEAELGASR